MLHIVAMESAWDTITHFQDRSGNDERNDVESDGYEKRKSGDPLESRETIHEISLLHLEFNSWRLFFL